MLTFGRWRKSERSGSESEPARLSGGLEVKAIHVKETEVKKWRRIEVTAFRYRTTVVFGGNPASEADASPANDSVFDEPGACLKARHPLDKVSPIEALDRRQAEGGQPEEQSGLECHRSYLKLRAIGRRLANLGKGEI